MRALDIMTTSVITATPEMSIHDAATLLADHRISGMPVVDETGEVVGIVSEGDLLRRAETGAGGGRRAWWLELLASNREVSATYAKAETRAVREVMNTHVISISENMPLKEIAEILERRHITRVPVMKDGALVGIVSRSNLIRALASVAPPEAPDSPEDVALRDAIVRATEGQRWALPKQGVLVKGGVVHLWGAIQSEEEGRAIRAAAERVPGVTRVESHMEIPIVARAT